MPGGKMFLKIVSVIFVIFGVVAAVDAIIELVKSQGAGTSRFTALIAQLLSSLIELIIGFMGFKKSDDNSQGGFFIAAGYALGVLMLFSMILSFSAWNLIGFLLPVMYIVGGYMMRVARASSNQH